MLNDCVRQKMSMYCEGSKRSENPHGSTDSSLTDISQGGAQDILLINIAQGFILILWSMVIF